MDAAVDPDGGRCDRVRHRLAQRIFADAAARRCNRDQRVGQDIRVTEQPLSQRQRVRHPRACHGHRRAGDRGGHRSALKLVDERIEYAGARLFTLFDGAVTPMVSLIKGFTDAQFRTDLGARVRRGQRGSIQQGRSAGGISYGYRRANRLDERGDLIAGLREIDLDQAEIVRRIFAEYVGGASARSIAARLNAEGVPPPKRGIWHATTINGDRINGHGILRNRLYIGVLVYGRTKAVLNPKTRRVQMKPQRSEPLVEHAVPDLRIIDDATWRRAQAIFAAGEGVRPERQRRPKHLLSGLGECGVCGAAWVKRCGDYWGCANKAYGEACTNNRLLNTGDYERRVLTDLKRDLLHPDVVTAYVREYHREYARRSGDLHRESARIEQKLAEAERRLARLVTAIAEGGAEFKEIRVQLAAARATRDGLLKQLASAAAMPVLALHPGLADEYRRQVEDLETALASNDAAQLEAIPRLRAMIARIVIKPGPKKRGAVLEVIRHMDEVLALAQAPRAQLR